LSIAATPPPLLTLPIGNSTIGNSTSSRVSNAVSRVSNLNALVFVVSRSWGWKARRGFVVSRSWGWKARQDPEAQVRMNFPVVVCEINKPQAAEAMTSAAATEPRRKTLIDFRLFRG